MGFVIQYGFCHAIASLTLGERCVQYGVVVNILHNMIVTVLCYTITYKNALDVPNTLNKIYNTCYALTICGSLKYLGSQCIVGKSSLCTYCVHICLCAIFLADTVYLGYINVGYG